MRYTPFSSGTDMGPRGVEPLGLLSPARQDSNSALAGCGTFMVGSDVFRGVYLHLADSLAVMSKQLVAY